VGSGFVGVKAGVLAGIFYIGSIALFNVLLLYALKPDVLNIISQQYPTTCPLVAQGNATSVEDCFSSVVVGYLPVVAFLGFFVTLIYAYLFGRFFESFPGRGTKIKGIGLAFIVLLNLLYLQLTGVSFEPVEAEALLVFVLAATIVYGVLLASLYRRYTKTVEIGGPSGSQMRIKVDGRDFTGKTRTFATKSVHEVRAEAAEGSSFREWVVSGGVTVEDTRSYETSMEVNGDGLLKALAKRE
jgi:hypothetical protein